VIEMVIPSTLDASLAPPGRHVASLFVPARGAAASRRRSWDEAKEEFADLVIDTVNTHAPNFKASVLGRQSLSPLDLERRFGLIDGDIFHGQLTLDQLFSARPVLGHADYRIARSPHLYLCGSVAHPGGGVTGLPGRNRGPEIAPTSKARLRDVGRAEPCICRGCQALDFLRTCAILWLLLEPPSPPSRAA
jgi:phytoene dehydrogenase-like protein